MGDGSDNIKGIKGVGIKTMQSKFPMLLSNDTIGLEDILDYLMHLQKMSGIFTKLLFK